MYARVDIFFSWRDIATKVYEMKLQISEACR